MSKALGYDSPLEVAVNKGRLKNRDWFMFFIKDVKALDRSPAIVAQFNDLESDEFDGIRDFGVLQGIELQYPIRMSKKLLVPDVTAFYSYNVYGVGIEKEVFVGKREIVDALNRHKTLKPYAAWFDQFEF